MSPHRPRRPPSLSGDGGQMTEAEHEHDEGEEDAGAPVTPTEPTDEELDDPEPRDPEPPADEPADAPAAQATTPEEWEKRFAYAERLFKTYAEKVTAKWEEDALSLAQFSIDSGAPPGFIDVRNAGHVDEDTKAAALEFLGFPREQDYADDPYTQTCSTCNGKTKTKTGSADPQFATRTCPTCKAYGYTIDGRAPSDVATPTNGTSSVLAPAVEALASGEFDAWNQPRILPTGVPNPNYGKTPDYWISVEPWGDTRGLTAQSVVS